MSTSKVVEIKERLDRGDARMEPERPPTPALRVLEVRDFLRLELPPREMLLDPVLPTKGLAMMFAPRGVGKTHTALSIAYAVASGTKLFRWSAPKPRKVLLIDGEMPAIALQERVAALVTASEAEPPEGYLRLIAADLHDEGLPDLVSEEGQAAFEAELGSAELGGTELLVLDNLSSLCRSGRENEADSWQPVQDFLLRLRRRGITVLMIHHAGKGGQQRGTSRREDVLDTIISLRRPADYKPREGARFEVHVEKARGVTGEALDPFEALLEVRDGKALWTVRTIEEADVARVAALAKDGLTVRDIAAELGTSRSRAQRLKEKGVAEGKIVELPKRGRRPRQDVDDDDE
jgi:putative DNA primase/helicase